MASIKNILASSPAQVTLYDSSNGVSYLGYLSSEDIGFEQKPLISENISGQGYQWGMRTELKITVLETDPAKIADLVTRRVTKQLIIIATSEYGVAMYEIYIQHAQVRNFAGGENDVVVITATTEIESFVELRKNLLSSPKSAVDRGNFDIDTDVDGLADGWALESTPFDYEIITPSFLGAGYGSCQRLYGNIDASDIGIYANVFWPVDQPLKVTASVWVKYAVDYDSTFVIQVRTKDSGGTTLSTYESSVKLGYDTETRHSYTVQFTPDTGTVYIAMYLIVKAGEKSDLLFDNAQLEFGELSTYTENQ